MKNLDELKLKADTLFDLSNDETLSRDERNHYYDQAFKTYELIKELEQNEDEEKKNPKWKEVLSTSLEVCRDVVIPVFTVYIQYKVWRESVLFETQGTITTTGGKQVLRDFFSFKSKR